MTTTKEAKKAETSRKLKLVGFETVKKVVIKVNSKVVYDGPGHFTNKDIPIK
ncbi:unnamed protein product [marine sediment metagenome]|uniref:Uncharacterized protein n=1 Tax=marine sediment metagenome TaxID=412755 RepID=X1T490_9ZZZZ